MSFDPIDYDAQGHEDALKEFAWYEDSLRPLSYHPDELRAEDVGKVAEDFLAHLNDPPVVHKQLASGVAVHFGSEALFIPGNDYRLLNDRLHRKITELACTYVAWRHAIEQAERDEMS